LQGRLSLQERLVVLMLAAILPLAALSVWFASREIDNTTELARSQLRFTASAVAAGQDRIVDSVHHMLGAITALPEVRESGARACDKHLAQLRDRYPLYANLGIADQHGRVLCLARGAIGTGDASDRLYFKRALAQRDFVMGEAVIGRATGVYSLAFAMPVTEGARIVAVAFAALDLDQAAAGLSRMDLPEGARVVIADRQGHMLMEYPASGETSAGRRLQTAELLDAAKQMSAQVGEFIDVDGHRHIFAAAPSRLVGGAGMVAVVSLDREQLTAASSERLVQLFATIVVSLVAGLSLAWWLGGRFIVKPAKQILGGVRRLEQGRLEARVPLHDHRNPRGEFARIAAAFNLMAESLQLRQLDLEAELGRSRSAYEVLDMVLNSMQEGLIAVDRFGQFIMYNRAAAQLFPLEGAKMMAEEWPRHFGLYHPSTQALYPSDQMPFTRAIRGESGEMMLLLRNAQVPHGRLLRCNYGPMRDEEGIGGGLMVFTDVTALEKAETDLVLLRNAVARLNDIVLITEAHPTELPGPRIVFVNEAFERLTGYSAREAIGNTPRMLQGPGTDRAALDRIRSALAAGQPVREELLNYAKDGRAFWLEIDIVPMADEAGRYTHLIAVQRDITARKQFEQQLMDREQELRDFSSMLQRTAEAAQAITRHQALDHTMQEVVDQARGVIGAHQAVLSLAAGDGSRQVVTAMSLSDKYAQWERPVAPPDGSGIYAMVYESGQPLRLTHDELLAHPRWRNFSGSGAGHPPIRGLLAVPLVNSSGKIIGLLQLSDKHQGEFSERDEYVAIELAQLASIALENARLFEHIRELNASLETRIAERTAELVRQSRLYRTLAEQAPEVVWNTDASGERLTFLNRAWYELVGGTEGDWLGRSGMAAIHPDDRAAVAASWLRSQGSLATFNGIRRLRAKDGTYHTMSYKGSPVFDENGQVAFWVGIDSDITGLKAIEEALRSSNQELEAFSYSVSHDLRAPLGAIDGFSKALAGKLEGQADEKARHYLSRIQAGVQKMEQLIEALLGLSRVAREPLRLTPVDLSALARETLEGLQMQQPHREVATRVQEGLVAQGDARLLRIVMENLLGNAWKFTSKVEQPCIEVGRQDAKVFFVRDNGVGFDMTYADKLFSVFQRLHTEAEFPGTGIGLATVRRIVARHQGRVWAESQPGHGTTFYFTLGEA